MCLIFEHESAKKERDKNNNEDAERDEYEPDFEEILPTQNNYNEHQEQIKHRLKILRRIKEKFIVQQNNFKLT